MPKANSDTPQSAFDTHFAGVYGYVAYRLAPDMQAAQEVTQEVFLAALEGWNSYRGDGTVLSWLRAIARCQVADYLRQRAERSCQSELDAVAETAASIEPEATSRAVRLAQSMRSLPPQYVELLEEKYLEGLSVRQIAQQRSRTEKAIESELSRARQMLKSTLLRLERREEHPDEYSEL
jgi:RNA polymerase sigma-70 factor (ECF subfamily)